MYVSTRCSAARTRLPAPCAPSRAAPQQHPSAASQHGIPAAQHLLLGRACSRQTTALAHGYPSAIWGGRWAAAAIGSAPRRAPSRNRPCDCATCNGDREPMTRRLCRANANAPSHTHASPACVTHPTARPAQSPHWCNHHGILGTPHACPPACPSPSHQPCNPQHRAAPQCQSARPPASQPASERRMPPWPWSRARAQP